jgi:hypothetical protein
MIYLSGSFGVISALGERFPIEKKGGRSLTSRPPQTIANSQ